MHPERKSYVKVSPYALFLATALALWVVPCSADVGVLVLEPIKTLGYLTRSGHSATYLSNICPDGSPVRMRLCHAGELGGVVSKYTPISENGDYDWAIVPVERFLNGVASPDLAPLIATEKLREAIEAGNFAPVFASAIQLTADGSRPDGEWKATLATRFDRTIYSFAIATSRDDDRRIVEIFNSATNRSHFNFFYDNCSDQTRSVFSIVLPHSADVGDRRSGMSMETPKGLVKALVQLALTHPEMKLHAERYVQLPGLSPRSREVLFPMENAYRNLSFAPYWVFGGFREFALGAFVYHQVISRFSVRGAFEQFLSPEASGLTLARYQMKESGGQRETPSEPGIWGGGASSVVVRPSTVSGSQDLESEWRAQVSHVLGSKAQWTNLEREFRAITSKAARQAMWPDDVRMWLRKSKSTGVLSRRLLERFEADGRYSIDVLGPGPWMTIRLFDRDSSTGLSLAMIGQGDPALAVLVLAAAIDYDLAVAERHRPPIDQVEWLLSLLRTEEKRLPPPQARLMN
jgi:hypothetical protein